MYESNPTDITSNVPWPTSGNGARTAGTSTLPGDERDDPAVVGLMDRAVQGAHETVDHLADRAAPAVRKLGETSDEWTERMRDTVRRRPLASIAAALALGAVIARITR